MICLKDILEMPEFSGFEVIAGQKGLGRHVSSVSVMDAPDIYQWMKGGEFLITSGYVLKEHPETAAELIGRLDKRGAAALGIKLDRFIQSFPQEALRMAEKLDFPVISIPFELAFTDIIHPVLQESFAEIQKDQFVQEVLTGRIKSGEEILSRARKYGWNPHNGGITVVVERVCPGPMTEDTADLCKILSGCYLENYIYGEFSGKSVWIISALDSEESAVLPGIKTAFSKIQAAVEEMEEGQVIVGIGDYRSDISEISGSFKEAEQAVAISRNMHREAGVSIYGELGVLKILYLVSGSPEADSFQEGYIGRLKEYDKVHRTELLETAVMLDRCGWNLKETSEKLYIHYNSMKYRYQKICEVLKADLKRQEERLNFGLALKLYQMRGCKKSNKK